MTFRGGVALSDQYEFAVLRELRRPRHGGWRGAVELAADIDLPAYTVRAALHQLRRRRMVERGGPGHWGLWAITERGLTELAASEQMRLVR
jgi:DNA-binding IclR family transcriptional regulator